MYTMNCKHKNKIRLYRRLPSTWIATNVWECPECGAVLGLKEVKVKMVIKPREELN